MADVKLGDLRDGSDGDDIVEGEAVAGVRLDTVLDGQGSAISDALEFGRALVAYGMSITAGVKFDDRRAKPDRCSDLRLGRLDEQADAYARLAQLVDEWSEMVVLARGIEAAFRRALLSPLGHDAGRVRAVSKRDRQHLVGRGHLEVQRQRDLGHQSVDVAVGDVTPVLAQVCSDAVGTRVGGNMCGADRVRMVAAARVPDGRDVIDVDAEAETSAQAAARLPGLIAGMEASSAGSASAS